MGLTIHFSGRLKSEDDYQAVLAKGRAFAERLGTDVTDIDSPGEPLIKVQDDKIVEYEDKVRGIIFEPHPDSEPIVLVFDSDNYFQQFCKTQYAGMVTHIEVVSFLRTIEPHFENFKVVDEGGYWETNDMRHLEKRFGNYSAGFDDAMKMFQKMKDREGSSGRVIDRKD